MTSSQKKCKNSLGGEFIAAKIVQASFIEIFQGEEIGFEKGGLWRLQMG